MSRMKDYLLRVCEDAGLDPTTERGRAYAQEMLDAEGVASSDAETRLAETLARLETLCVFAENYTQSLAAANPAKAVTHAIYAEELAEIISRARE